MECHPILAPFARTLCVPGVSESLFMYDSGPSSADHGGQARYPVVLVHGLGDEADTWRHLFPLLARRTRTLAPDLPGFGRSNASARVTVRLHAEAVLEVLRETGKAVLVGNSLGAAVAELVAFRAPELVAAIALVDGGLPSAGKLSPALLASLVPGAVERPYRAWRADHEGAYRTLEPYYASLSGLDAADRDFLRRRVIARVESESQCRAYGSAFRSYLHEAVFRRSFYARRLARLAMPLLVAWGERDRVIPVSAREPILSIRGDAMTAVIPDCGHLPQQENPAALMEALEGLLAAT
jgi:pimeloyl-ACP methyl ester carboxylesterase